jgi:chromodomain-helicase-DNA-binding protein 1
VSQIDVVAYLIPPSLISPLPTSPLQCAPGLRVQIYSGDKDERVELRDTLAAAAGTRRVLDLDVLVTTYELVLRDEEFFHEYKWNVLVVDEAHRLKNAESQLFIMLSEQIACDMRVSE